MFLGLGQQIKNAVNENKMFGKRVETMMKYR